MSTKRILINKEKGQFGSLRVARVLGQTLQDLEVENVKQNQIVDCIYNAEVKSTQKSLQAAFVNIGSTRNGFLPINEIAAEYYPEGKKDYHSNIGGVLFEGQKILVQVNKEERGTKGAALSTFISLAGSYLVLMLNKPRGGGISRRIEGEEREELKKIIASLNIPEGMSVIVRTAGMGKSLEELRWDLDVLLNLWQSVKQASKSYGAPYLIHQDSDVVIRTLRDHLRADIGEILVDDQEIFDKVVAYIQRARPDFVDKIKLYNDPIPLFSRFQIEKQIESVFQRKVRLPSGGEIVIDRTEALTAIDVNSAQATKGSNIEETARNTNLEAANEIARQLRLRDLGGLIVIDFIDMEYENNRRAVEEQLRTTTQYDRARVQFTHISRFGLMEMSRQCLRSSISNSSLMVCPRCHGEGTIRNVCAQALSIIRLVEDNLLKQNAKEVQIQLPVDVATYILNERHQVIDEIERSHKVNVIIIPNPHLQNPQYDIKYLAKKSEKSGDLASYELLTIPSINYEIEEETVANKFVSEPAIKNALPSKPAPMIKRKSSDNWLNRIIKALFSGDKKKEKKPVNNSRQQRPHYRRHSSSPRYRRNNNGNRNQRQHSSRDYNRQSSPKDKQHKSREGKQHDNPRHNNRRRSNRDRDHRHSYDRSSHKPQERPVIDKPVKQEILKEKLPTPKSMPNKETPPPTVTTYTEPKYPDESGQWEIVETKKKPEKNDSV